ncbi:cupin domain-containing protein [Fibrella aquatilis]|uniref:Cupin domain-containing protein n=1 Tax=Fibrella aquatilis TaxID=2817059 RepID=A0A939G999_9BACT|nr:cupin domain-containing protein [Fibrella aquatilis]MBO0932477.1 cupin domain-containing protein [Fibrella aquatilis]
MQRRTFLASSLATTSLLAQAAPGKPAPAKPFTVKAGEARFGVHTPFQGVNANDLKVSGKDTGGMLAVFEYMGHQKVGPPLHVHTDQDELFYVVEGEYRFQVGKETFTVKAGDTVFGPRNMPHTWIQLTDVGKLLYQVQPAGKLEDFFLVMNELKGPPTEALIQRIHADHGMTVLGPPLSLT